MDESPRGTQGAQSRDAVWAEHRADDGLALSILDHVAHPIFVKDRAFRLVVINAAFCALVGMPRCQLLGKTDHDFAAPEEADFFRAKDIELFTTRKTVDIPEEIITDSSGKRHVLATTKVPLCDASGEVTHLVGIIHDITALKAAEEALRCANEELERRVSERSAMLAAAQQELLRKERLAVLGQLAGGLAHQIRNPLGSIMNAAYILRRLLVDHPDPEVGRAISVLLEESRSVNRTITDLLEYARVRPAYRQPAFLSSLIERTVSAVGVPRSVSVRMEIPRETPAVAIDEWQLLGALENIVRNAVEAMPSGGTLTVTARSEDGRVVLSVRDSGAGIAPEVLPMLFDPLVTNKPMGLGLGLTTARALVENQGGSIRCESAPGEGACFEISLPVAEGDVEDVAGV